MSATKAKEIPISRFVLSEENPRKIKGEETLARLLESIEDFPEMMEIRKIVVDENWTVLGGNQRVRALIYGGWDAIPEKWVQVAPGLTEAQKQEFIVKDNVSAGEWDWDKLLLKFDFDKLTGWGLDINEYQLLIGNAADVDWANTFEDEAPEYMRDLKNNRKQVTFVLPGEIVPVLKVFLKQYDVNKDLALVTFLKEWKEQHLELFQ